MKKMINWIKDYKFYFFNSLIIFIFILLGSLSNKLKIALENIFFISSLLIIFLIIIWIIYIIIKNKKEKNRLYDKYGVFEINKINEFLKCEYNDEIISNDIRYDFFEFVEYSCNDFLEEVEKIDYNRKKYEKDLKKYSKIKLKDLNTFIKLSNEVMDIISIWYDDNGNRKKIPFIENNNGEYYGKLIKKKIKGNKKYEIRQKDSLYRIIIYNKVWLKNEKESAKRLDDSIEMWKEDKSLNHITDNLDDAIKIAEEWL